MNRQSEPRQSQPHQGQCPSCHATIELTDDPQSLVVECDCGAELFACGAIDFDEFPIHCTGCGESYLVEPADIGELVQCECGKELTVPDAILRLPLQLDAPVQDPVRNPVIIETSVANPVTITTDEASPILVSNDEEEDSTAEKSKAVKKTNWLPILLGATAVVFFLGALGTFVFSRMETDLTSDGKDSSNANLTAASSGNESLTSRPRLSTKEWAKLVSATAIPVTIEPAQPTPPRQPNPTVQDSQPNPGTNLEADSNSPFGGRTAPRSAGLPRRMEPREWIPAIAVPQQTGFFDSAYQDVFESYEAFNALKPKSGGKASNAYKAQLGETLTRAKHAFDLSARLDEKQKRNELGYLLAFLSYTAGHLIEASLYGETIARFGDVDDPSTHEALMIAFAAAQEANSSHWGIPGRVGELHHMESLADLVDEKWPDDPQRDVIWMSLAKSYSEFGKPLDAARALSKIKKNSPDFKAASLAAGMAHWNHFVDRASEDSPNPKQLVALLKTADKALTDAVKNQKSTPGKPGKDLLVAKFTLAKIAYRLGDLSKSESWLTGKPTPVVTSINTGKAAKNTITVDLSFAQSVFDLLYKIKSDQKDFTGADQALKKLAGLGGGDGASAVSQKQTSIVVAEVKWLLSQAKVTQADFRKLNQMMKSLDSSESSMTVSNQLWLAESFRTFANRASAPNTAVSCFTQAANIYAKVIKSPKLPAESLITTNLKYADLLRQSGQSGKSIEVIKEVLKKSPNIFDLQLQVALALQQLAIEKKDAPGLLTTINGQTSDGIWGWAKLAVNLHQLRFSPRGTDVHGEQLMQAQYHLARCRLLASHLTDKPQEASTLRAQASRQVKRVIATLPKTPKSSVSSPDWEARFTKLLEQIAA